jgi:hypothetical protein
MHGGVPRHHEAVQLRVTRLALILAALLAACSPATTRRLCDTSDVVLDVARPASPEGDLAAQIGRFARAMFCPRRDQPTGATDRLPES